MNKKINFPLHLRRGTLICRFLFVIIVQLVITGRIFLLLLIVNLKGCIVAYIMKVRVVFFINIYQDRYFLFTQFKICFGVLIIFLFLCLSLSLKVYFESIYYLDFSLSYQYFNFPN